MSLGRWGTAPRAASLRREEGHLGSEIWGWQLTSSCIFTSGGPWPQRRPATWSNPRWLPSLPQLPAAPGVQGWSAGTVSRSVGTSNQVLLQQGPQGISSYAFHACVCRGPWEYLRGPRETGTFGRKYHGTANIDRIITCSDVLWYPRTKKNKLTYIHGILYTISTGHFNIMKPTDFSWWSVDSEVWKSSFKPREEVDLELYLKGMVYNVKTEVLELGERSCCNSPQGRSHF